MGFHIESQHEMAHPHAGGDPRLVSHGSRVGAWLRTNPSLLPCPMVPSPARGSSAGMSWRSYAFLHFGVNTFTDKEWGYGDESPSIFQPTDFDADQIVTSLKAGGHEGG